MPIRSRSEAVVAASHLPSALRVAGVYGGDVEDEAVDGPVQRRWLSGRERNPDQQEQRREHRLSAATHTNAP